MQKVERKTACVSKTALIYDLSRTTIYTWINKGYIRTTPVGSRAGRAAKRLVDLGSVDAYLKKLATA